VWLASITDPAVRRELQQLVAKVEAASDELRRVIRDGQFVLDHNKLNGLDFASSLHTGFASSSSLASHTGDSTVHFTDPTSNIIQRGTVLPSAITGPWIFILDRQATNEGDVEYHRWMNSSGTWVYVWAGEAG